MLLVFWVSTLCGAEVRKPEAASLKLDWLGPEGGDIRSLAMDPFQAHVLYAGTDEGVIYKSIDGAQSWFRLETGMEGKDLVVQRLITDSRFPKTVWAAAWMLRSTGGTVWSSTDEGKTWKEIFHRREDASVRDFIIPAVYTDRMYLATLQGIYTSDNHGRAWDFIEESNQFTNGVKTLWVSPIDPERILVGTRRLIYRTENRGKKWELYSKNIPEDSDIFRILSLDREGRRLLASACSGIYRSTDGGQTWSKTILNSTGKQMDKRVLCLAADKENETVYAGTSTGLYRSTDRGNTWDFRYGDKLIVHEIAVDGENRDVLFLAAEDEGVLKSVNGGYSFTSQNKGLIHRGISAISVDPQDQKNIYIGMPSDYQEGGIYRSRDGGKTWDKEVRNSSEHPDEVYALMKIRSPKNIGLAGTADGLYIQEEEEKPWHRMVTKKIRGKIQALAISSSFEHHRILAAGREGLFISDDLSTWEKAVLPTMEGEEMSVFSIAVCPYTSNRILAGGMGKIWWSEDRGYTWNLSQRGLPNVPIQSLVCMGGRSNHWLVGTRLGIYISKNSGGHWARTSESIGAADVTVMISIPMNNSGNRSRFMTRGKDCILATDAHSGDLLYSFDSGVTWHRYSDWNCRLWSLWAGPNPTDGVLLGGTSSDGLFSVKINDLFSYIKLRHQAENPDLWE